MLGISAMDAGTGANAIRIGKVITTNIEKETVSMKNRWRTEGK